MSQLMEFKNIQSMMELKNIQSTRSTLKQVCSILDVSEKRAGKRVGGGSTPEGLRMSQVSYILPNYFFE